MSSTANWVYLKLKIAFLFACRELTLMAANVATDNECFFLCKSVGGLSWAMVGVTLIRRCFAAQICVLLGFDVT